MPGESNPPFLARFYYGWVITGTLAITETVSWGILYYAFSALLTPMRDDLGWSVSTLTGGFSAGLIVMGLVAPAVGIWLDRHGPRLLMTAGSILGTALIVAWSQVSDVWLYYLIWIGIGLAMSATLYEPAFTAVTAWFERDRARAILIITILAGFASTIFLPLTGWFETRWGWRDALLGLAVILGVTTILPHALILRRRPEDLGLRVDGLAEAPAVVARGPRARPSMKLGEAVRDRSFWWITSSFFLETISSIAIGVHMIPYLIERGESAAFAATATGLIGAAQVAARITATILTKRVSQAALTAVLFAMQVVAIVILLEWEGRAGILVAVLIFGAGRGVVTLMRPGLVVEYFGRSAFGAISGTMSFFITWARGLAPIGAGLAYVWFGDYRPVFWLLAAISGLGALAMLGLIRRPRADVTMAATT
ncbi:MAG: MFS transporter [Thermomicrobiales bacterium]|nr:MFS transporter [Thermomicrobiales bacterium]